MIRTILAVFIGGGLGSVARYLIQAGLHERIHPYNFPWSTFIVNVIGSFLIGIFYTVSARFNLSMEVRLMLTTGLCGGFTTFSTFCYDGFEMIQTGHYVAFICYTLLSIILGISSVFGGIAAGRLI